VAGHLDPEIRMEKVGTGAGELSLQLEAEADLESAVGLLMLGSIVLIRALRPILVRNSYPRAFSTILSDLLVHEFHSPAAPPPSGRAQVE
jgi:hypothetical protein